LVIFGSKSKKTKSTTIKESPVEDETPEYERDEVIAASLREELKEIEEIDKQKQESTYYPMAYRLLSEKVHFLFPRLIALEAKIKKSGQKIPYEPYVCGMVLASVIAGIICLSLGIVISLLIKVEPAALGYMLPIFFGFGGSQATFGIMYMLPAMGAKSRASKIQEELPYFIGYMATLSASGLTLEGIYKAMAQDEDSKEEIVNDSRLMVRNIDVLGMDIITALKDLITRIPPGPYAELKEGLIATVESGGSLKDYFIATAKVQLEEKKLLLRKMTAALGIVAEMYTVLMIVAPLLASIMLSIMAIMTPNLGGFSLVTLMKGLAYIAVPLFGIMMLLLIDSMVPKR
jgi:flagellar protein FlaJ